VEGEGKRAASGAVCAVLSKTRVCSTEKLFLESDTLKKKKKKKKKKTYKKKL